MQNGVKSALVCVRCNWQVQFCVPVRVGVPGALRCDHPTHGAATKDHRGELACEQCGRGWRLEGDRLTAAVEDALLRGTSQWIRFGSVRVECG